MARDTNFHHHLTRQSRADAKIALHRARMGKTGISARQRAEDARLMNEMRHNKVAVDLNRALFDYGIDAAEA